MEEKRINQLSLGMKLGKHPSQLKENEYSFMLNGNIMNSNGDVIMLTNESSSLLCSRFKDGYKVVGNPYPVISLGFTFWFLYNPITNDSEIGIIKNTYNKDTKDLETGCSSCGGKQLILDKPLEEQEQYPTCIYETFVNAKCLNFNLENPIRSWAKVDDCSVRLYFVQKGNPSRYIDYPDYQKELFNPSGCPRIETSNLDCDKIKIFKDACYPILSYADVVSGGTNTAGTLQFGIQYADAYGNAITNSFYFTNKIDIWDKSKTITTDTAYTVAKSVKIHIDNLNPDFDWFNLIVLKTVKGVTQPYLIETFSNTNSSFNYTYAGIDRNLSQDLDLTQILARKPIYEDAAIISESNGIVLQGNLDEPRTINLQPVINKLNLFWETVQLEEGDYANPILNSKYVSFLRDEVYPIGIQFFLKNTNKTATFHIPGRSPSGFDLADVTLLDGVPNPDVFSSNICDSPSGNNPRWTVYNTGINLGAACGQGEVEECDNIAKAYANCTTGTFYQDINTLTYYSDYALTIPLPEPCTTITCDSPSGDCLDQIEALYPDNLSISPFECNPIVVARGECLQVPHYSTTGVVPNDIPYPSPSGVIQNTSCEDAVSLAQYACSSDSIMPSYVSKLPPSPAEQWYNFVAAQSGMVINLVSSYNVGHNNSFVITLYQAGTPIPCTSLNLISSQSTASPYILFDNLVVGATYFVTIEATTSPISGDDDYYYICQSIPPVEYYTEECTPNTLTLQCTYEIEYCVKADPCNAQVYEYGNMAYWESTELYPCLPEVWGDLANTPIRHPKFPDNAITPFYKNNKIDFTPPNVPISLYDVKTNIYPIGIRLDVEQLKGLLQEAVDTGLITNEEKLSICGYRILRGNRVGNQSIIAKGIINDVWKYRNNIYDNGQDVLYPNYSYNPRNPDPFNLLVKINSNLIADIAGELEIPHPYHLSNYVNNKYVFHSPNTHFNNPGLGSEIKLELEQVGIAQGRFTEVVNHAKYQYTGAGMFYAAWGLACAESFIETVQLLSQTTSNFSVLGSYVSINFILAAVSVNIGAPGIQFGHYYEWLELLQKFAPYRNYAWYYTSDGKYNDWDTTRIASGNIRRALNDAEYLTSGILSVKDGANTRQINNYRRENSVYLNLKQVTSETSTDSTFLPTNVVDDSRWFPNDGAFDTTDCKIGDVRRPISSYYASIKNQLPSQYGQIDQIEYIDTGYNGQIDWTTAQDSTCNPIFGGDTYLGRMYNRTQVPFYLQERVGYPPNSDVQYGELGNIGFPRFFMNYPPGNDIGNSSTAIWGNIALVGGDQADYNFACLSSTGKSLFTAGVVTGILSAIAAGVSLSIGLSIVYTAGNAVMDSDTVGTDVFLRGKHFLYSYGEPGYMCESDYNVDLRHGTNQTTGNFYPNIDLVTWTQPLTQETNLINTQEEFSYNRDYSSQNRTNLSYFLPPNFSQEKEDCKVVHPNRLIYSLQDNDNNDRFDGNLVNLPNNYHDFPKSAGKLINIIGASNGRILVLQEDGYSVHNVFSTIEADIKNIAVGSGSLFSNTLLQYNKTQLGDGGSQTQAYSSNRYGIFYADNKRGEIYNFTDAPKSIIPVEDKQWFKENLPFHILDYFPEFPIDNSFKAVGMSITFDSKFDRLLLTKKDYTPKPEYRDLITYDGANLKYNGENVSLTDERYFCFKGFTVAYSPITQSFISFYSFIPDFTVSLLDYFQTGRNEENGASVWSHLLTNKSYQVFFGELQPFIIEYATTSPFQNKILSSIEYEADFRKWVDSTDFYLANNVTYNKSLIYNQNQSTGLLFLELKDKNNLAQWSKLNSGKVVNGGTEILVENVENFYRFNTFYDISRHNNQSIMQYDCNNFYRTINPYALDFSTKFIPEHMRGDYFVARLINDKYSNYQIVHKFSIADKTDSKI